MRQEYESGNIKNDNEFREVLGHVLSDREKVRCLGGVALQTEHGPHLADLETKLMRSVGYDRIQLVVLSRPSAYGEQDHTAL